MGRTSYIHLEGCRLITTTELAALIEYEGEEYWIPFAQMGPGEEEKLYKIRPKRDSFTLTISQWLAEQKGINFDE